MSNTWRDSSLYVGGFTNLKIQVTSSTQLSITADTIALKSSSALYIASAVSLTNTITTSGANGLDTGSEASNTWYYVWVIYNGSTVASLISTSETAPTMPSGYTFKARIGAVRNDNSSNLYRTLQLEKDVQYVIGTNPTTIITMDSGATANTTNPINAVAVGSFAPSTASLIKGTLFVSNSHAAAAPNASYGAYTDTSNPPPVSLSSTLVAGAMFNFALESSNIYWTSNGSNNSINVFGWRDNL